MSVNRVILLGRLGKDPELKYSASGIPVCRFSLATNETFKNKAGERQEHTEWHSVVCFGKLAEVCGQYLCKAKLCYIEGSIRCRKWQDQNGEENKSFDIIATQMRMLSSSSNSNGAKSQTKGSQAVPKSEAPKSTATAPESDNPFEQEGITDQDIPF
ncbi:MAG: single-stranded DNA-binding protein [Terriglobia bacterium]